MRPPMALFRASWEETRRIWHEPAVLAALLVVSAGLAVFVVLPLVRVLATSFLADGRWSLKVYRDLFSRSYNIRPLWNSLKLGVVVAVASVVVGFVFAYGVTRADVPFKSLFRLVATFPIISPPFVISLAMILLFGNNGFITRHILGGALRLNIYGLGGLAVVETLAYFPTAFLTLVGVLQAIDPALEDAALDLGASRWRTFVTVTLPLAVPGVASALLLVFIESLADFGNPVILSGNFQVLAVQAYLRITGMYDLPGGAGLAVLLLLPSLAAFILQKYWVGRKSYVTVTGRPQASGWLVDRAVRALLLGGCLAASFVVLLFYGTVLVGSFVKLWGVNHSFTLANYRHVFVVGWDHIKDTLFLSSVSTPVTGVLGMVIAYLVTRKKFLGRSLVEFTSLLTFAVPGTVVGIGYILAFNEKPFLLTGTAAIIILLFVFRNVPVGIQAGVAALAQIDASIEEASTNLGADAVTTFRRVTLPLITPAFFSGLVFSFVRCMTAISAVVFVVSGRWSLITLAILGSVENSDLAQAAAFCIVIIIIVLVVLGLIQALLGAMFGRGPAGRGARAAFNRAGAGGRRAWTPSASN